jgi:integrase
MHWQVTCDVLAAHKQRAVEALAAVGLGLTDRAYVFSNDPAGATAWNPDWTSHLVSMIASQAGVSMNVKSLRHYTATQLLSCGIDLRKHRRPARAWRRRRHDAQALCRPISEVDRRAAAYLSDLTAAARLAPT